MLSLVFGNIGIVVMFNGLNGIIGSSKIYMDLLIYSEEFWFKMIITSGGKLIGFGDK